MVTAPERFREAIGARTWSVDRGEGVPGREFYVKANRARPLRGNIRLHVFIWQLMGRPAADGVDHKDGQPLNNAEDNLRQATDSQNQANRRSRNRNNTSGIAGVAWDEGRGRWRAYLSAGGKRKELGRFDTVQDAQISRDLAALKLQGEFAILNPPTEPGINPEEYRAILGCVLAATC